MNYLFEDILFMNKKILALGEYFLFNVYIMMREQLRMGQQKLQPRRK